jgi:hypothetical protein
MDDDLDERIRYTIYMDSRADWDHDAEHVAEFEGGPPA